MSNKMDATLQNLPFYKVSAWIAGEVKFLLGEEIREQGKQQQRPRIIVFADIVGSTAAARKDAENAVVNTIAHHVAHGAAAHSASKPFSAQTIKSVGDEVVVSVHPKRKVNNENIGSVLLNLIGAILVTAENLKRDGIVTKVGVHVCREYTSPLEVLKARDWFITKWRERYKEIPPPKLAALFPPGDILGDDMNRAARVAHAAPPNSLLVSEDTYRTYLRNQRMEKAGFFVSDQIVFQDLKGIVSPSTIKHTPVKPDHRTVRMVARDRSQLAFVWPFHSCALIQSPPQSTVALEEALGDSELRHNLLTVMTVDQGEAALQLNIPEEPRARGLAAWKTWLEETQSPKCLGIARFCASSFETYNAIMQSFIYGPAGKALTYTHAIMTSGWESAAIHDHAKVALKASLERQPIPSANWEDLIGKAHKKTRDNCLLFARTKSFADSIHVMNELTRPDTAFSQNVAELGLLYGQWDIFALFKGPDAFEAMGAAILRCRENLRHNTNTAEMPSGVIYKVAVVTPTVATT